MLLHNAAKASLYHKHRKAFPTPTPSSNDIIECRLKYWVFLYISKQKLEVVIDEKACAFGKMSET
jgi:hypothetical protein